MICGLWPVVCCLCSTSNQQPATGNPQPIQTSSFVTTLGRDTLSFEQYERAGSTITGDWVTVYGGIMYHHYVIELRSDGTIASYALSLHRQSGKLEDTVHLEFRGDSVRVASSSLSAPQTKGIAEVVGPIFANTISLLELLVARARATGRDSTVLGVVRAFGPYQRAGLPVVFRGADSVRVGDPRAPLLLTLARDGSVQSLSARATTTRMETVRVPRFDLDAGVRRFPNVPDDAPILGAPALSPRDTVRAQLNGATITIDYGRPSVRGRAVWGHGVLGDTLWRAGANAATQLTTTADLMVGGKLLPAGTYSLWVHAAPNNSSYELVINSQHGQWGTEHHFDRDLVRVPLAVRHLASNIEQFAIVIQPRASGEANLTLRWANLELSVPIAGATAGR